MDMQHKWRVSDAGGWFYGPPSNDEQDFEDCAIAEVHKTWSPTRSSAGYTVWVVGKVIGKHFPTVKAAKDAAFDALDALR